VGQVGNLRTDCQSVQPRASAAGVKSRSPDRMGGWPVPFGTGGFVLAEMYRANLSHMKPDLYTKIVLTVIAPALVPIACNAHKGSSVQHEGELS
jgi:hypothetical protein